MPTWATFGLLGQINNQRLIVGLYIHTHTDVHTHKQVSFMAVFQAVPWSAKLQPWISLLHFTLSFTLFSDKCILFKSSFTISPQVLLGLPLGLLPSTTNSEHFLTQSSSPFLLTCPNHLNLLFLQTSPIVSTLHIDTII
jgi:hypothetical protein